MKRTIVMAVSGTLCLGFGGVTAQELVLDAVSAVGGVAANSGYSLRTVAGTPVAGASSGGALQLWTELPFPGVPIPSGVGGPDGAWPIHTTLSQNAPNPFYPSTRIRFQVGSSFPTATTTPSVAAQNATRSDAVPTRLVIFDVAGRVVRELVNEPLAAGNYELQWDGRNAVGDPVPTGVFFARLTSGATDKTIRMVLSK